MHVRACLPRGVDALAVVLQKTGCGGEAAVLPNRVDRETAAGEVRNHQVAVSRADVDTAGVLAAGHAAVEKRQFAALRIDRVAGDRGGSFLVILF